MRACRATHAALMRHHDWPLQRAVLSLAAGRSRSDGNRWANRDDRWTRYGRWRWSAHLLLLAGLVPVRQVRQRAEVRHAVAGRHAACAARRRTISWSDNIARHRRPRSSAAMSLAAGRRRRHRAAVHLVAAARDARHAAAGQPQHDPEGGARAADHRLVQVRHRAEHDDGVLDLLLPDPADHRARPARGRARPARPGAHAAAARAGSSSPRSSCPARCPTSSPA